MRDGSARTCASTSTTPSLRQVSSKVFNPLKSSSQSETGAMSNICSKSFSDEGEKDILGTPWS